MWTEQSRGRMGEIARKTKRYPSDLTDEEWERMAPLMPKPGRRGRPREVEFREVINAVRYLVRSGCGWRMLPVHFGHWRTVYGWFRELARRFLFQTIHDVELMLDRERAGREASPSGAVIDSQSIKAPQAKARGYDAAKKVVGRKRHIAVDTDGRLLMVHLTPADLSDSTGAQAILDAIRKRWPWVKHLFADATYDRLKLMDKAAYLDFVVEIIRRSDGQKGFEVLPRRWVVERTFGWMTRWRRLVRDYEQRIDVSYRRAFALTHLQPVVVRRFELRPNGSGRRRAGTTGQRRPAHLDAAMLAIGGLGRRKRQGGVTEDQLHVFKQRALIALERQHIGAALIGDRSGDLALTGHGVGRDSHAGEAKHLEQLRDRGDLVGLVPHRHLPQHEALLGRPGRDQMQRRGSRRPVKGAPQGFAVERHHTRPALGKVAHENQQAWNCSGSSSRNTREKVSWLGMPCSRGRNWRRNGSLACPNRAMSEQSSPPHSMVHKAMTRISCRS